MGRRGDRCGVLDGVPLKTAEWVFIAYVCHTVTIGLSAGVFLGSDSKAWASALASFIMSLAIAAGTIIWLQRRSLKLVLTLESTGVRE